MVHGFYCRTSTHRNALWYISWELTPSPTPRLFCNLHSKNTGIRSEFKFFLCWDVKAYRLKSDSCFVLFLQGVKFRACVDEASSLAQSYNPNRSTNSRLIFTAHLTALYVADLSCESHLWLGIGFYKMGKKTRYQGDYLFPCSPTFLFIPLLSLKSN